MKNLLKLFVLFMLFVSIGCTKSASDKNTRVIMAFDLGNPNLEIPATCKPPLASEENKLAFVHFRGKVDRCIDLVNTVPELNVFSEMRTCLNQIGESFRLVTAPDCRASVMTRAPGNIYEIMNLIVKRFYSKHVVVTEGTTTTFKWDALSQYFSLLSVWYDVGRNNIYPLKGGTIVSSEQSNDFDKYFNSPLWDDLQAYTPEWKNTFGEIVNATATSTEAQTDINKKFEIFKTMLAVNNKVLKAAFASEMAQNKTRWTDNATTRYPSPLLASYFGDALNPFMQRLKTVAKISDIACKLKSCNHSLYETNTTYWLLRYFDTILSDQSMASLDLPSGSAFSDFMGTLTEQRSVLKGMAKALSEAYGATSVSSLVEGSDYPSMLRSFREVFAQTHDLLQNYENTRRTTTLGIEKAGLFTTTNLNEVSVGFSKIQMDRHIKKVKDANERLGVLRDKFNTQKHTLIQEILALNSSTINLRSLENKITLDVTDAFHKKNELDAVRSYVHEQKLSYAKKIVSLIQDTSLTEEGRNFYTHPSSVMTVSALNTSAGANTQTIEGTILQTLPNGEQYTKGDVLQINVSGEWSPTCSLVQNYGNGKRFARTGPRGFTLVQGEGTSTVDSVNNYHSEESFSSTSISANACAGYSFASFTSVQMCASASMGNRTSDGTTNSHTTSSSSRSDASFDLGLTLSQTPFSYLPAGALLLVEIPRGQVSKEKIRNIHVLREQNSIILENSDSDYYLIGNDCASSNNSGELTVTLNRYSPQGNLALDYINKVTAVASALEEEMATLIDEGQLSFSLLEGLKLRLKSEVGTDISHFSGQIRTILDSYIESEVTLLGLKSQIVTMERDLESKKLLIDGLLEQYSSETEQRRLRVDTRNWLLSNLDLDFVNKSDDNKNLYTLNRILNTLENSLVSYIDFKYRLNERDYILGDISLLQSLDFTDSFDSISNNITTFTETLLDNLQDDIDSKPLVPQTTVGLRIPNPYYKPTFDIPLELPGLHPVLSDARSRAFWESLLNWDGRRKNKGLSYEVNVDDLYTDSGLGCFAEAPIIETMGMFFIPENEGYITDFNNNYHHRNAKLHLESTSSIPFETGLRSYNFVGDNWRYMDSAVRMAKSADDATKILSSEFPPLASTESGLATGRPIFGRFDLGVLPPWRKINETVYIGDTPLQNIKELFVGYVVSASNANYSVNLNWINHCVNNGKRKK